MNLDVLSGSIDDELTMNRYAYVNGNPISYIDPFGLSADSDEMLKTVGSFLADAVPGLGTLKGLQEIFTGVNYVTGDQLSVADRVANGGGVLLSWVPGGKIAGKALTKGAIDGGSWVIARVAKNKNSFKYLSNFEDHIINAQGIVRKGNKGVVGGHNLQSFEKILADQGWNLDDIIVSRTIHPKVTGIYEIEYRLPALDRELRVVPEQYKNISQPKTVYDPSVVSNEQIIAWGKEAMNNGVINGRLVNGYSSNGLRFTGYLDNNGNITNFHPSF